jgi:general secretion pathway protein C
MESQAPRVLPNYVNGQPQGFRLQGIRSGSIFSAIGIRNGDVIVGVNGTEIDSPQRAMEIYQAMLQQDTVEMEVLRRGRPHTLNYTIK